MAVLEFAVAANSFQASPGPGDEQIAQTYGPNYASFVDRPLGLVLICMSAGGLTLATPRPLLGGRQVIAYLLPVLGAAVVVLLALNGHPIATVTGLVLLTLGSAPLVTTKVHRYLQGLPPRRRPSPYPRSSHSRGD
jgi:hypothetical protein